MKWENRSASRISSLINFASNQRRRPYTQKAINGVLIKVGPPPDCNYTYTARRYNSVKTQDVGLQGVCSGRARDPQGCWGAAAIVCNSPIRSLTQSFTLPTEPTLDGRCHLKTFPSAFPAAVSSEPPRPLTGWLGHSGSWVSFAPGLGLTCVSCCVSAPESTACTVIAQSGVD